MEGIFVLDPTPLEFPFQRVLVIPAKPKNFYNFPTWLVAPCNEYFFNNAAALYFSAKDKLVSAIKREKSFYLC